MNDLLSICIPTYNRAELLRGCLESIIPQAKKHGIPLYISDNASTDDTAHVVAAARMKYSHIYYSGNSSNLGAERNQSCVLKRSKSKYAWLIGDRARVNKGAIDKVLKKLSEGNLDLMVVNSYARPPRVMVKDIATSTVYTDQNKLLGDLGWWMTFVGASIWNSEIIRSGKFEKYEGTDFVHVGVLFEYLTKKNIRVYWCADPLICATGESGWYDKTFETFAKNWYNLISSLPAPYTEEEKKKCIKDLNTKNKNFSIRGFLIFRSFGYYDLNMYKKYRHYFQYVSNVPKFILFLIAILPPIPSGLITLLKSILDRYYPRPI